MLDSSSGIDIGMGLIQYGITFHGLLFMIALHSVRFYAAMLVLPATADQLLQGVVRNGAVLMLSAYVAFGQSPDLLLQSSTTQLALLLAKEVMIGALLGFAMGTIFWTAEGIGLIIDFHAGFSSMQQSNPISGQQSTPVGNLLAQLAVVGFYMLGGFMVFTQLMVDSFAWWPIAGVMPNWERLVSIFLPSEVRNFTQTVLKMAGPIVVTLMLIEVGMGLLTKAAEKLEPGSLTQPIKGAAAIMMLALLVSVFFDQVRAELTLRPVVQRLERALSIAPAPR